MNGIIANTTWSAFVYCRKVGPADHGVSLLCPRTAVHYLTILCCCSTRHAVLITPARNERRYGYTHRIACGNVHRVEGGQRLRMSRVYSNTRRSYSLLYRRYCRNLLRVRICIAGYSCIDIPPAHHTSPVPVPQRTPMHRGTVTIGQNFRVWPSVVSLGHAVLHRYCCDVQ